MSVLLELGRRAITWWRGGRSRGGQEAARAMLAARVQSEVAHLYWTARHCDAATAAAPRTRAAADRAQVRNRILYLYHQADATAAKCLWEAGWPAYT